MKRFPMSNSREVTWRWHWWLWWVVKMAGYALIILCSWYVAAKHGLGYRKDSVRSLWLSALAAYNQSYDDCRLATKHGNVAYLAMQQFQRASACAEINCELHWGSQTDKEAWEYQVCELKKMQKIKKLRFWRPIGRLKHLSNRMSYISNFLISPRILHIRFPESTAFCKEKRRYGPDEKVIARERQMVTL